MGWKPEICQGLAVSHCHYKMASRYKRSSPTAESSKHQHWTKNENKTAIKTNVKLYVSVSQTMMINLLKSHSEYLLLFTVPLIIYQPSFISKTDLHLKGLMSLTQFDFEQSCDYWWQAFLLSCLSSLWALSLTIHMTHLAYVWLFHQDQRVNNLNCNDEYRCTYFISKFFKELHSNVNQFSSFSVIQYGQTILQLPSIWNFYLYKNCYILLRMSCVGILGKL